VFWQSIEASSNKADFDAYLQKFPNGEFAVLAHNRIQSLTQSSPPPDRPSKQAPDSSDAANALGRVTELPPTLLQYALRGVRAYLGPIDGRAGGKAWQNGVRAWQRTSGLTATGSFAPEQIVRLVKEAADRGQPESENTYGIMLASGIGVQRDDSAAVMWFERAASSSAQGKYNLALMLRDGRGAPQDMQRARDLFTAAQSGGYGPAAAALKAMAH
jgi:TPR repeat protein